MGLTGYANGVQYGDPSRTRLWGPIEGVCSSLRAADVFFLACILFFGAFQFFATQRVHDFQRDDVFYSDSGRSLVERGFYGINGHPETNQPPGLPFLLGLLSLAGWGTHLVFLRVMTVFETLGFLVTYELLRRQLPRIVASSICLLLISSRIYFLLASQWVFPGFPYFFTSLSALLVAKKFESSKSFAQRIAWGALLTVLIAVSLMFASAAVAFLGAIFISTGVLFFRNPQLAWERVKIYSAVFLVALAVHPSWMHRKPAPLEWPIPGYPQSYLSQLKVKSGNYPELGMATLADLPDRVLKNAADDAILLSQTVLRHWIDVAWMSVFVAAPITLIVLGWSSSVWRSGDGLQEWYFAGYQFIYLLWPWKLEPRFFLPIAPLALLYLWRGGKFAVELAKDKPRLFGVVWYPVAVILAVSTWFWMHGSWIGDHQPHAGLQDETSFVVWILSALLAVRMLWDEKSWQATASSVRDWFSRPLSSSRVSPMRISWFLAIGGVVVLTAVGLFMQVAVARRNLDLNSQTNANPPDVQAAQWIHSHTAENAIIMARHVPVIYHHANREVVWFPPSSDSKLLMEGIQRHRIDYVIAVSREDSYYLPPDDDCLASLLAAYPGALRLVQSGPEFRIFQRTSNDPTFQETTPHPAQSSLP
jgi:hypothetical protein